MKPMDRLFRRRLEDVTHVLVRLAAAAGAALLVALSLSGPLVVAASSTTLAVNTSQAPNGYTTAKECDTDKDKKPKDKDKDKKCPPPVIPEAPAAALLPLTAIGIFGAAFLINRRQKPSGVGSVSK